MIFTVKRVVKPNAFEIEPAWNWSDCSGNIIKFNDCSCLYTTPDCECLLNNQEIEAIHPVLLNCGSLLCEVFIEGQNIRDFL
jgi:hypothetical protein